jgi:hypothetical protein
MAMMQLRTPTPPQTHQRANPQCSIVLDYFPHNTAPFFVDKYFIDGAYVNNPSFCRRGLDVFGLAALKYHFVSKIG